MNISRVITLAIVCIAWFACGDTHAQEISFATSPAMQVTTPIPQRVATGNDFDGDGMSEILWYNPVTSQVRYWNMVEDASHLMHQGAVHTFGVAQTVVQLPQWLLSAWKSTQRSPGHRSSPGSPYTAPNAL